MTCTYNPMSKDREIKKKTTMSDEDNGEINTICGHDSSSLFLHSYHKLLSCVYTEAKYE